MRKLLYTTLMLAMAQPALAVKDIDLLETGNKNFKAEKSEESKWLFKIGMEYMKYPTALPNYTGENESVKFGEQKDISGLGLGFSREFYITSGFSTNLSLGTFYFKTLDKKIGQASKEYDIEIASVRDGYYVYGYDASISVNYTFENKVVDIQPFIEFGVGAGHGEIEKKYKRDNITNNASSTIGEEKYDVVSDENFTFTKASLGINFVGYKGLMSFIKVSSMMMNKTDRKTKGTTSIEGGGDIAVETNETELSETEVVTTAQLGIGYFF
jgi:hypothetical protein